MYIIYVAKGTYELNVPKFKVYQSFIYQLMHKRVALKEY